MELFEFSLNVFTEFSEFNDKNICHYCKRVQICHLLCWRPGCYHSTSKTHVRDRIFILSLIHVQLFIRFPEFTKFLFHLMKTPLKDAVVRRNIKHTAKQRNHVISFKPIRKRLTSNSIHELTITSVWIDVIVAFNGQWKENCSDFLKTPIDLKSWTCKQCIYSHVSYRPSF